jgi:hypothetical protein
MFTKKPIKLMPINQHLMDSLLEGYGTKKGRNIYYALEEKRKQMKAKIANNKQRNGHK